MGIGCVLKIGTLVVTLAVLVLTLGCGTYRSSVGEFKGSAEVSALRAKLDAAETDARSSREQASLVQKNCDDWHMGKPPKGMLYAKILTGSLRRILAEGGEWTGQPIYRRIDASKVDIVCFRTDDQQQTCIRTFDLIEQGASDE